MPTFEALIQGAPSGFLSGCSEILKLDSEELSRATLCVLSNQPSGAADSLPHFKTLAYINRCRVQAHPKPTSVEIASVLDSNTSLSREVIASLVAAFDGGNTTSELTDSVRYYSFVNSICFLIIIYF